jgi:1-deoxy-D-xylulose-5-phosphate synthase
VNARFAKPIDSELIIDLASNIKRLVTVEENTLSGGFGSYIADTIIQSGINDVQIRSLGLPDKFIEHGTQAFLRSKYGLDASGIVKQALSLLPVYGATKTSRV